MKKKYTILFSLFVMLCFSFASQAQETWPKTIKGSDGATIRIYQFQPETFNNNALKASAAISVTKEGSADPVFGVAWFDAVTSTQGKQVQIESINISSLKLPGDISDEALDAIQKELEEQASALKIEIPQDELESAIKLNSQQSALSEQISNKAPKIIYSTSPSLLVVIDGEPKIQHNPEWGVDAVVNTPFTLVRTDGKFYLYGGKHWYMAPAATGPYSITTSIPQSLQKIESLVKNDNQDQNDAEEKDENTIYKILVTTQSAELIQSNGEAKFTPVENTDLLYVSNSEDDIFMDVASQEYYVLISGRWYHSKSLTGNWDYTSAEKLPEGFAKIPEGSPKDNVLASVAGTDAANDAVEEAAVPQTAKVDRKSAKADVAYDGDPRFEDIEGTDLEYAVNTPASVLRWRGRYYSIDNGVWFESGRANGPWVVSVTRPYEVALIPPRYPVYSMKYVYIYDVTPEYVYMGYTPGYLNNFIYGPTVVYGTGYYYQPWFGTHFYARPYTWGFSVRYNPWIGWGIGYRYSAGWFNIGFGIGHRPWGYWGGGWWGPRTYRPAYCWSPHRFGGSYYGRGSMYYNRGRNYNVVHRNYSGNIYRNRGGIVSRDYQRAGFDNRFRGNRNSGWSSNNNNRGRIGNAPNRPGFNRDNRDNRNNMGSRPSNRSSDRPAREYNPSRRNDPYNRNNSVTPGDRNRLNNRDNRPGRDFNRNTNPPGNREGRPNISPNNSGRPEIERNTPGGISRPERGERLHSAPDFNRRSAPAPGGDNQPRTERQFRPQQREVQRREPSSSAPAMRQQRSAPVMRQQESRGGAPGRSGGERPSRSGGEGRRGDHRN